MNQQLFEKGLKYFQNASELDPDLHVASLNQGIALLNLARIEPARALIEAAVKKNPEDAHAWFNLGLLNKNSDNPQGAVEAFRHVTQIDPNDADSWYFLGAAMAQLKQYPQAIDAFQHALKLNPLHASGEFGIARAYQQSGDVAQAREHLVRSSTLLKINSAPLSDWLMAIRENIRWWKNQRRTWRKRCLRFPYVLYR